jgi:hypothetical protein
LETGWYRPSKPWRRRIPVVRSSDFYYSKGEKVEFDNGEQVVLDPTQQRRIVRHFMAANFDKFDGLRLEVLFEPPKEDGDEV